jgi:hypothetical protein
MPPLADLVTQYGCQALIHSFSIQRQRSWPTGHLRVGSPASMHKQLMQVYAAHRRGTKHWNARFVGHRAIVTASGRSQPYSGWFRQHPVSFRPNVFSLHRYENWAEPGEASNVGGRTAGAAVRQWQTVRSPRKILGIGPACRYDGGGTGPTGSDSTAPTGICPTCGSTFLVAAWQAIRPLLDRFSD